MIGNYSFQEILFQRDNYRIQKNSLLDFLQDLQKDVEQGRPIKGRLKEYVDFAIKESDSFDFGLENCMIDLPKPKDDKEKMEWVRMELLNNASNKPIREVYQVDGFTPDQCDSVIKADQDGYGLMAGWQNELRATKIPVRIQIIKGTNKEDAVNLLRKGLIWLEASWEFLINDKADAKELELGQ